MMSQLPLSVDTKLCSDFDFQALGRELREEDAYEQNSKNARVLVKGDAFSMTLVAMKKGAHLKEHRSPGPATAIVLEGRVLFQPTDREQASTLNSLSCAVFSQHITHSVTAEEPTLLLIIFGQK